MTQVQTVIDRANNDPTFRGRLRADPAAAFREAGLEFPREPPSKSSIRTAATFTFCWAAGSTSPSSIASRERADSDAAFKELLLHDPRAAVEDHTGAKLPPTCKVHVREAAQNTMYLYVAGSQDGPEELTDEALEAVSGGSPAFLAGVALGIAACFIGGALGMYETGTLKGPLTSSSK